MTTVSPRFDTMLDRLNKLSVTNHHDAYEDVAWDDPTMALSVDDDRLRLYSHDPLAHTAWYEGLSDADKSRVAMFRLASQMKTGWQFENLLQRGLLKTAWHLENGSKAFRYVHHELIEESQHTLMFQEYVNRSGLPVAGMARFWRVVAPAVVGVAASVDKALFLLLVLGGEEPIDHLQRLMLREGGRHPLAERIMKIHVTEEARHISFAKHWLSEQVPRMGRVRRFYLSIRFPIAMGIMVPLMLEPTPDLMRHCGLPKSVVAEAYAGPAGRRQLLGASDKLRRLADELDLLNPVSTRIWKAVGLWRDDR